RRQRPGGGRRSGPRRVRAVAGHVFGAERQIDAAPPVEGVEDAGLGAAAEAGKKADSDAGAADAVEDSVGAGHGLKAAPVDELTVGALDGQMRGLDAGLAE